jgi:hypothetical protein
VIITYYSLPLFLRRKEGATEFAGLDTERFARHLWGDWYFNRKTRRFQRVGTATVEVNPDDDVEEEVFFLFFVFCGIIFTHVRLAKGR